MNPFLTKNIKYIIPLGHIICLYALYLLLFQFGIVSADITSDNLINRDAQWYLSLVEKGYVFTVNEQSNTAFFPLFSFIWKSLSASPIGISLFNASIYFIGVIILIRNLNIKTEHLWMLISTPTLIFCFIPYSEALFFLTTAILLVGLKKNNLLLVFFGCLFAGLTRSVIVFFIPASLLILLFYYDKKENRKVALSLITASLLSFIIVMYILYLNTGIWDSFFASQREWGHHIQLPKFPFRSWRRETLWEDLIAITLSAGFGITSVILFVKHFVKKSPVLVEPHVLFSLLYLTGVGLFVFIFGGGDFHSLNRYVFCTPFFWIVCLQFTSLKIKIPILFWLGIVLTLLIVLSSNGLFIENIDLGKTAVYSLIIGLFMQRWIYWTIEKKHKIYTIALIIIGFAFQIHLFHTYLSGKWIG